MSTMHLSVANARSLASQILKAHETSETNAQCVAKALVQAEIDGQKGHGLSRLPSYAAQAASGKVDGQATPRIESETRAAVRIDAAHGFAFPALALAIEALRKRCPSAGIAAAAIYRSHHFGQAGYHVEELARKGLIGIALGNSPKAIAPWGGKAGLFGTNPIAMAAPRAESPPLVIDLSLSKVARGKVMVAAESGKSIPEGWALDENGNPTTDANAALNGTMIPMGDAKGAALVMMVEILAAGLTGANFGYEASSFFSADGEPPGVGQLLIGIDPSFFSGGTFSSRLETLLHEVLAQDGTRLPGSRRLDARKIADVNGLTVPTDLHEKLLALAARQKSEN